ncbi:MAG: putative transcriptional regulator, PurR family [Rariglobus sp.]|jgi:LacI family transcriptional regulator|nr:putative transcriptional regulator, PurR family [Rariglobus sp.]
MPPRERATSLKDIAQALDVSYSLVSKVMGGNMGNTRARPEVVQAIQAKAREMNYQPHPLAGALKRGRKGAVGVLIHAMGEEGTEIASNLLRGISAGFDEHRLRLWLRFFESDDEFLEHFDKRARYDMDGVIVAGIAHPATFELIKKLHASGLPVVSVLEGSVIPEVANVMPDVQHQGYLATDHLLASGCKRIAHLVTTSAADPETSRRYRGFLAAHTRHGISPDPDLIFRAPNYKLSSGEEAVRQWLAQGLQFDGIVAQSDHQAIGAIHELLRRGIRVPDAVRVVGVDDSPLCLASPVPLTSVTAEWVTVGRHAADMITAEIDGERPASLMIAPHLVVRRSSTLQPQP